MLKRRSIQSGMIVRAASGARLGVITACGNLQIYVRKGLLNPEKYVALYGEIEDLPKGEVVLRRGGESLTDPSSAQPDGPLTHTKPIYLLPPAASAQS
ncbi:MAG TPA: hypothetical protein VEM39_01540 [Myxococcaceae bacterium]|nr:hypothetical protein [Myxococcaceae bacterium]